MRVLLAFDKFKDALTARQAGEAAAAALRAKHPDWELDLCPLTDGGDGFCETLCANLGERIEPIEVRGPRGTPVLSTVGFVPASALTTKARKWFPAGADGEIAVVDLASASGLALLTPAQRDPWHTTTFGTGELLDYARHEKTNAILLGIGGSATNDLGLGALAALGFKFLDAAGVEIGDLAPATWERIARIVPAALNLPPIFIACDVTNPLLGPRGATATFGPQKGLSAVDGPRLEAQLARMAALLCEACGRPLALADTPGAGAAGGIGFGLMVAADAKLVAGFDLVSDWLDLPRRIAAADLVLTGEGRYDATSLGGKGPGRIAAEARRLGKRVYVFAGSLGIAADADHHAITPADLPVLHALPRTAELLQAAITRVL